MLEGNILLEMSLVEKNGNDSVFLWQQNQHSRLVVFNS